MNGFAALFPNLTGLEEFIQAWRVNWSGAYHIDPNAATLEIGGPGSRKGANSSFCRTVDAVGRQRIARWAGWEAAA